MFDVIVHFIIQKLKNKRTFLKNIQTEKAEEPLILTEREETKTRYSPKRTSEPSPSSLTSSDGPEQGDGDNVKCDRPTLEN